jgi:hypothetical protein
MRLTRASRDRLLFAECEPDLAEQANTLLKLAAEADAESEGLKNGSVIEYGWAPLMVRTGGRELVLCEPDYGGDVNQFVPLVDRTLRVLSEQAAILKALGVSGVPAKYNQAFVFKRDAFQNNRLYLHRRAPVDTKDSGWYIGVADDLIPPDEADLDALCVYQLLSLAPASMKVMALPHNYLVVFNQHEIEAVFDDQGKLRSIPSLL